MADDGPPQQPEISHEAQITSAHVLEVIERDVIPRLIRLEDTITEAGLNGHTPYLKAFLEQYAGTYQIRQAWITVRSDLAHRLGWLLSTRSWAKFLIAAAIGGLATGFAANFRFPHLG